MSNQPAFDEATARRWLSWLARGMKSRGLTVFMIEDLQPGWLTRGQLFAYIVVSSLCQVSGIAVAFLAFALGLAKGEVNDDFIVITLSVLSSVPFVWFALIAIESHRLRFGRSGNIRNCGWLRRVFRASIRGAGIGLFIWLISLPFSRWPTEWMVVVMVGGMTGFLMGWATDGRMLDDDIQTLERLEWSWRSGLLGAAKAIPIAMMTSLLVALSIVLLIGPSMSVPAGPEFVLEGFLLLFLFVAGPLALLIGGSRGVKASVSTMKVVPNQGIRESFKNSATIGGVTLIASATIAAGLYLLVSAFFGDVFFGFREAALVVLPIALLAALLYGGHDVIRHYTLRVVLHLFGAIPFNIAGFLDYAANELQILQKVGGGYIFIHRFLLEHFADMSEERSPEHPGVQSPAATNAAR